MTITENSTVKVHYVGKLTNNVVFDSSINREPLEVTLGKGNLIPGFEKALYGMTKGDKKTVTIPVDEAYGKIDYNKIQEVEKQYVPQDVFEGQTLTAQSPNGSINVVVREVREQTVVLDGNYPLAGQDLVFDLEIVEVV